MMRSIAKEIKIVTDDLKKKSVDVNKFFIFFRTYILTILTLILTLSLFPKFGHSIGYCVFLFFVTGFTQNALGVFMHEGSHYFFSDNKKKNDFFANILFCFAIMNTIDGYRTEHMMHHKYSGTENDPYINIYTINNRRELFKKFIFDFTLLSMIEKFIGRYLISNKITKNAKAIKNKSKYLNLFGIIITNILLILLFYYITNSIFGYFIFWILPLMIIPAVVNRIRTIAEHYNPIENEDANRTIIPTFIEYLLIAPYGYSYHYIHHNTANIPYYYMSTSHKKLIELNVKFNENEIGFGYLKTFFKLYKMMPNK